MEKDDNKMTRLIRELCGGKPVSELPLASISSVLSAIEASKKVAISNGQVEKLMKLQSVAVEISEYEKKHRFISQKTNRPSTVKQILKPTTAKKAPPQSVVEAVFEDLLQGFSFEVAETYLLPSLIQYAKNKIDELLALNKYMEAQKIEDIHRELVSLMAIRSAEGSRQQKKDNIRQQLAFAKRNCEKEKREFGFALQEHDERAAAAVEALDVNIEKELQEFDNIMNGPLLPQDIKFSAYLLNLRETEKFLVKSRRFEEAAIVKKEADEKECSELKELQKQYGNKKQKQKQKIYEGFMQKKKCLIEKNDRLRQKIEQKHSREIAALEKNMENIKKKLDSFDGLESENRIQFADVEAKPDKTKTFITNRNLAPRIGIRSGTDEVNITKRSKSSRLAELSMQKK